MNWLDWVLIAFLLTGLINGFKEGFVRLVIGMIALVGGFIAASWFHGFLSASLRPYISNEAVATVVAFNLILLGVLVVGALIASLFVRVFKLIGLTPVDRILGAGVGVVRASLVLVVVAMLMMAFIPRRLPAAVHRSTIAPYIIAASNVIAAATPYDIRHGVEQTYDRLRVQFDDLRLRRR